MNFNDDELAALEADAINIGVFFRLETAPVVRLWLGFGDIEPGVNIYDTTGAKYLGFGDIREIPNFRQLLNGGAERVEFSLSGVSGDAFAIASGDDAEQVQGTRVSTGFALMRPDWSLLGPVRFPANYVADFFSLQQTAPRDPKGQTVRKLVLSAGSDFTGRRRPAFSYWSDPDQQARYPGDLFCSLVSRVAHGFEISWPVYP